MLRKISSDTRGQLEMLVSLDDLVPQDHLLRDIDRYVDFNFIYDLVEPLYDTQDGRPSLDPVQLIKLPLLQYLCSIKSMRQTIKDVEVNVAYRWFLKLGLQEAVPHFSTFGKNYVRRFEGTDLFEQIFYEILAQCLAAGLVDTRKVFIDGTHVKAHANNHKFKKDEIPEEALFYTAQLREEIKEERVQRELKALKSLEETKEEIKEKKVSKTDPESGWFHKGEHKEVFAYAAQVACDAHGWVLAFTSHAGNLHDSRTFKSIYDVLQSRYEIEMMIMDAGYKTPAIAHLLIENNITPVFPYKRPMTKKGNFKKYEFQYNEEFDGYTCPAGQWLGYRSTNKIGYREYKSDPKQCQACPLLERCTQSSQHVKVMTRHIWAKDLEAAEHLRQLGFTKEIYAQRKETIERLFGTAKEFHGLRYTNQIGKGKLHTKLALTFSCLNIKKLAKMMKKRELEAFLFFAEIKVRAKKYKNLKNPPSFPVDCLQSELTLYSQSMIFIA
ncbi:MAG: IS1182 family transposase [Streptococcaceae bacterium]|jgi:transposase|nr:IS1182 family transposase [Streptococcaceae bacterium]